MFTEYDYNTIIGEGRIKDIPKTVHTLHTRLIRKIIIKTSLEYLCILNWFVTGSL